MKEQENDKPTILVNIIDRGKPWRRAFYILLIMNFIFLIGLATNMIEVNKIDCEQWQEMLDKK